MFYFYYTVQKLVTNNVLRQIQCQYGSQFHQFSTLTISRQLFSILTVQADNSQVVLYVHCSENQTALLAGYCVIWQPTFYQQEVETWNRAPHADHGHLDNAQVENQWSAWKCQSVIKLVSKSGQTISQSVSQSVRSDNWSVSKLGQTISQSVSQSLTESQKINQSVS